MRLVRGLAGFVLLSFAGAVAWAQAGWIDGQITREDGVGLGGVIVVVDETGDVMLTDPNGSFSFGGLPVGTYTLSFTLGYNATVEEGVEVTAGESTRVDKVVDWDVAFAETITVVSASKRVERIVEAPAAISVVTKAEIEKQAAHGQLPKLVEFTPGVEVTQSGIYDYNLNTRGFNSSLNRRVATLIDGRNPSVPFLGAQEWAAIGFPLDDLSSAEMVRGPSAALYGANASSGVLNLITRSPRNNEGGRFRLTGGELSTLNADLTWAGGFGNDWYFKLNGGYRSHGDFTVSRNGQAEYAVPCPSAQPCLPQERVPLNPEDDDTIYFGSLRFDKYFSNGHTLALEGGTTNIEGPTFQTGIGRVQLVDVDRPWARLNYNTNHFNLLGYYTKRDAPEQTALGPGNNLALDTERIAIEAQTNWGLADDKAQIVAGVIYMEEDIDSFDDRTGRQTLIFEPISNTIQAAFAQLDWSITDKFKLVLAGRYDESDLHSGQFSPKGALVYSFSPNHTVRLTYNEAFQVANYSEFFLQAQVAAPVNLQPFEAFCQPFGVSCGFAPGPTGIFAMGNASLDLEEIETVELGYSGILGGKAFLTIDYYQSEATNFITDLLPQLGTSLGRVNPNFGPYAPPAALPAPAAAALVATLQATLGPTYFILSNNLDGTPAFVAVSYTNFGDVDTEGIDLGLNFYVNDNWTIDFTYSWFDFEVQRQLPGFGTLLLPNTPENKAAGGISYTAMRWNLGFSGRWDDDFLWAVGPFQGPVKSYTTFDLNGNYDINERISVGITVANLFDEEHYQAFGGDLLSRRALGNVAFRW